MTVIYENKLEWVKCMTEFTDYQWYMVYNGRHYGGTERPPTYECNFRPQINRFIGHATRTGNIQDRPVVYRISFYQLNDNLKRIVSWSLKEDGKVRIIKVNNKNIIYWKAGRKFYINGFPVLRNTLVNSILR